MAPDQLPLFHKPVRLRLQRLLAERFQLELRRESIPTPVVDMTGINSRYDFHLEWAPEPNLNPTQPATAASQQLADAGGISIFTALQQQLGLKLEARTDAADRLVIVWAAPPSAN
jgi:uncharacterized protein (TIGR03435 family)